MFPCAVVSSDDLMDSLPIEYSPHPDATQKTEADALANAYAFLIRCHEDRKAAETDDGDEGEEAADHDYADGVVSRPHRKTT